MRNYTKPKLVKIIDKHRDELLPRAERDWQASREELNAEIPAMPDYSPRPFGRIAAVIFLLIAAFIAGLAVGRL